MRSVKLQHPGIGDRMIKGYSEAELVLMVRQERLALERERISLVMAVNRLKVIDDRLKEIEKAEGLLCNGFGW